MTEIEAIEIEVLTEAHRRDAAAQKATAESKRKQVEELEKQLNQREEDSVFRTVIREAGPWVAPAAAEQAAKLLRKQFRLENGVPVITDEAGLPVVGANGLKTAQELVRDFRRQNPNFVRPVHSAAAADDSATSDAELKKLFSSPAALNKLANDEGIAEYRRRRAIAKERGITR